ncbi:hypothetical protein D1227_06390 [Henriciella mobilis]|uniref:hypothetical protein n=1 Tax=Henriciella mobilis TaxID=2305467 RepID=UPI000E65FB91|nr:hypothetical protein [Henriciella mobilis]RIJ15961.1 hypothetical protein D1231_09210 [Henriciella mobilis]RIJ21171.1 hypothetical protein D1227_12750 [Henriciella mobilis]RIJ23128.1 hypothetical protein D1227_06390 [Henriciella mobilis]
MAKSEFSDDLLERISKLMITKEGESGLSMNEIIDRMAAAIFTASGGDGFEALVIAADRNGEVDAMTALAKWRRMARAAHKAYLEAVDEKR